MELSKKSLKRNCLKCTIVYLLTCSMFFNTSLSVALAGPEGAQVVNGQVAFQQSGYNTTITASDKAIINYSSFDIARPEIVEFIQPGSSASVLNRILSANPTNINGTLLANGRVFFVNPAGVYIGDGARINVNQLVASGLNITNSDFINGRYNFAGGNGSVTNSGDITAEKVYLIGRQVANSGSISCPDGYVVMASGDRVFLGEPGSDVVLEVEATSLSASAETIEGSGVLNEGTVDAAGGKIVLAAAGDIYSQAISNVGSLSASAETGDAGQIKLTAADGTVINSGSIEATSASGTGGTVEVLGDRVGLFDAAEIDASGSNGGGTVLIGGDYQGKGDVPAASRTYVSENSTIKADATENGNGGKVIVWADEVTRFYGDISARGGAEGGDGGFVEVSGKDNLGFYGYVDTLAPQGNTGTLLLDPEDIVIEGGTGTSVALDAVDAFDDPGTILTITEKTLEDASSHVALRAEDSITVSGTFSYDGNGEGTGSIVMLDNNLNLTMETRNDTGEGSGGIDLTGVGVEFRTQGSGSINIETGIDGDDTGSAPVIVGKLTTLGTGSVVLDAEGTVTVNDAINSGGSLTINGSSVNLDADLSSTGVLSGSNSSINVLSNDASIQDAIEIADTGATVTVGSGTYDENVTVNKANLTLQSTSTTGTILTANSGVVVDIVGGGDGFTLGGADGEGFTINSQTGTSFLVELANAPQDVEISWNKLDTTDNKDNQGISVGAAGATGLNINNNIFTTSDVPGIGGVVWGDGSIWGPEVVDVSVTDNTFTGPAPKATSGYGVYLIGATGTSAIQNNTISNYGTGVGVFNGPGVSGLTISGNEISACTNGLRFGEHVETGMIPGNITDITVQNNKVTGNTIGIRLHPDGSHVLANNIHVFDNDLSGNTSYGVKNELTNSTVLDASGNWWGSADGPTIASNTFNVGSQGVQIDEAMAGTVEYVRWLDSGVDGNLDKGFQPTGSLFAPVTNITKSTYHSSIGSGIALATAADTLKIENGTFSEAPTVDRNLTLTVPSGTATMTSLSSDSGKTTGLSGLFAANTSTDPAFQFDGAVTLAGDVTLTSTNKAITFKSTIDGEQKLTVNAGTGGTATFGDMIGDTTALSGLEVDALNVDFDNTVEVDDEGIDVDAGGYVNFDNTVDTTNGGNMDIDAVGKITTDGKITASGAVDIDSSDNEIEINGAIDPTTVSLQADDDITINANITGTTSISTHSGQDGTGNVIFGAGVTLDAPIVTLRAGDGLDLADTTAVVDLLNNTPTVVANSLTVQQDGQMGNEITPWNPNVTNNATIDLNLQSDDSSIYTTTADSWKSITATAKDNIELQGSGDININSAGISSTSGGVKIMSTGGTISTPGAGGKLDAPITGYSDDLGSGVTWVLGSGKSAIVILSWTKPLKLGENAILTANGRYDPSIDDRLNFLFDLYGEHPGDPVDVAIYLGSILAANSSVDMGAGSVSIDNTTGAGVGALMIDAFNTVSFTPGFESSLEVLRADNVKWLEVVSRSTPDLETAVGPPMKLPHADNLSDIAGGLFDGTYVLRGKYFFSTEVLAAREAVPLALPRLLEPEAQRQVEGPDMEAIAQLLEELGIGVQPFLARAYRPSLNTDLDLIKAAEKLLRLRPTLEDVDGTRIAALIPLIRKISETPVPVEEQMASFVQELALEELAGQWINALTEYAAILNNEIGLPADNSVARIMVRYGGKLTGPAESLFVEEYLAQSFVD